MAAANKEKIIAILDANVLYPAPVRDFLLYLANENLYAPKWTDAIHEEWIRNLLKNRTDLKKESLLQAKNAMNTAFPDANITRYEPIIEDLQLPDPDDCHILAAAIKAKASLIITFNIKDFPAEYLRSFGIMPQHPDDFITSLFEQYTLKVQKALKNQTAALRHPPMSMENVLSVLAKCGLKNTIQRIKLP